jgi:hypothetical protein
MILSTCAMCRILILLFLAPKLAKTQSTLAQNFLENDTNFDYIRCVFLILFLMYLTRKIAKTDTILAQSFREFNADLK